MPKLRLASLGLVLLTACGTKADRTASQDTAQAPRAAVDSAPAPAAVAPAPVDSTPAQPSPAAVKPATPSSPAARPAPKPVAAAPVPATSAPTPAPVAAAPAPAPPATQDPWHPAPKDTLDFETYQGWKQFELNCSRCHGEYAVGSSFAPALVVSLKEGGTIPTKEMFITTVCAGRLDKGMPSWCALGLEMTKIEQIYQYVKGRADGKIAAGRPAQRP